MYTQYTVVYIYNILLNIKIYIYTDNIIHLTDKINVVPINIFYFRF